VLHRKVRQDAFATTLAMAAIDKYAPQVSRSTLQ